MPKNPWEENYAAPASAPATGETDAPWNQTYATSDSSAPPQPSLWDRIKGIPQVWEDQMSPVDQALAPRASDGTVGTGVRNVLGSAASTVLSPIMHPVDSILGAVKSATPLGEL